MRNETNAVRRCGPRLVAMAVLALTVIGPVNSQEQMDWKGGLTRLGPRDPSKTPPIASRSSTPAVAVVPQSISPDNDFSIGYPDFLVPADTGRSVARSALGAVATGRTNRAFYGVPAALFPWNQAAFKGYAEVSEKAGNGEYLVPGKYALQATSLSVEPEARRSEAALLIAHLPEHARLWVEGTPIVREGPTSYFQSPPLVAGKTYSYLVRVAWIENGHWVNQTRKVGVAAGGVQALYLRRSSTETKTVGR